LRGKSRRLTAAGVALTLLATLEGLSPAQETEQDDLHARLDAARTEIRRVQARADSVQDQIASIDAQRAAVAEALATSRLLVDRTQARIAILEREVAITKKTYKRVLGQARAIAISLYKDGLGAQLEALLGSDSIDELNTRLEYSSAATERQTSVIIKSQRLKSELLATEAALEITLAEAIEARDERMRQKQHLKELRLAQAMKLEDLRARIQAERREAEAIEAQSAALAEKLASTSHAADLQGAVPATAQEVEPSTEGSDLAWPLIGSITSGFGPRWGGNHTGIDIDGVTGQPIRASKSGSVVTASYDNSGYGYHVVIDHGGGLATLYAHASKLFVSVGESVVQGETIAAVGSTGASTGDHLHFEVRVNGSPEDPLAYLP
jgi:murein DD-endopeptidase MepM/ murein hydrolase activator NlpD